MWQFYPPPDNAAQLPDKSQGLYEEAPQDNEDCNLEVFIPHYPGQSTAFLEQQPISVEAGSRDGLQGRHILRL
jgi:hypothetical protein